MCNCSQYRPAEVGDTFQSPCGRWLFSVEEVFGDGAYAGHRIKADNPRFPIDWWEHTPEELHFLGFTLLTPPTGSIH